MRRAYGFDVLAVEEGSADYVAVLRFFQRVRLQPGLTKGHPQGGIMIENGEQLQQACDALSDLYRVLASYRAKILPVNPRNYAVIARGPLEEIPKIQAEIDAYLGLQELVVNASEEAGALREVPPLFGHK